LFLFSNAQVTTLRRQNRFANRSHAGLVFAGPEACNRVLHFFREPERVACAERPIGQERD